MENKQGNWSKYFWGTIIILLSLQFIATMIVYFYPSHEESKPKASILESVIVKNLKQGEAKILEDQNLSINKISKFSDKQIDDLFDDIINKNVDDFLDFHYSFIGNYAELGIALRDKILDEKSDDYMKMLLGEDFSTKLSLVMTNIQNQYSKQAKEHFNFIGKEATKGADKILYKDLISNIEKDVQKKFKIKGITASLYSLSAMSAAILLKKMVPVIVTKGALKMAVKTSTKIAGAITGAEAGAVTGSICGPLAWICSPVGAVVGAVITYVGIDVAVNKADEALNRETLKKQIIQNIEDYKIELKSQTNNSIKVNFHKLSDQTRQNYKKSVREMLD